MEKEGFVEIDELEEMAQEVRQPHLLCSKLAHQPSRAMQLAVKYYKDAGGSYSGPKKSNNKLRKWGRQKWQYAGKKGESRYLPKKAIAALSPSERAATNRKKKADTRAGKQFSKQPKSISNKTRRYRV